MEKAKVNTSQFVSLKKGIKTTESRLRQAREETARLAGELRQTKKPTKKLRAEFQRAQKKARALKDELAGQRASLHSLRGGLNKAGLSTKNLTAQNRKLASSLEKARKAQAALNKVSAQQRVNRKNRDGFKGKLMGAATTAVTVAVPVKLAMDFESSMSDVQKVVDFKSPEGFKQLGQDILAMTTDQRIPLAAEGVASIVAAAGQANVAKGRAELLAFAETAAKMGVAFDIAAGDSGSMLANWRSSMKLNQSQAVALADAVNYLSNNMNAQAGPLGELLQRQGSVAKGSGLTAIESASLGAALLSSGAPTNIAATAMKNLTVALAAGKAATSGQKTAFNELGMDAEGMAARMQENAPAAIKSVFKALADSPIDEQTALVTQLFGKESLGAIMPLLTNLDTLEDAFSHTADATKYAGSMQKEFDIRSKTSANSLQLIKNRATRLGVNLGNVLLPPLNAVGAGLGWLADSANFLVTEFPTASTIVVGLAAGTATLAVASIGLGYAYTFVNGGLLNLKKLWLANNTQMVVARARAIGLAVVQRGVAVATSAWTGAQWLLNAAMTANPIGLIIVGAAALGAAGYYVYKKWEPLKKFFTGITTWLSGQSWFESGKKLLGTLAKGIFAGVTLPFKAAKFALDKVRQLLPFSDAKTGPLSNLTGSGRSIMETMAGGVKTSAPRLAGMVASGLALLPLGIPGLAAASTFSAFSQAPPAQIRPQTVAPGALTAIPGATGPDGLRGSRQPVSPGALTAIPGATRPDGVRGSRQPVIIHYSPTIKVAAGSADQVRSQLEPILREDKRRLKALISEVLGGSGRLNYG